MNNKNCSKFSNIEKNAFFQKIRHSFPFNVMYEGGFIYTIFAVLYGLYYMKKNNIEYVYSTYSPYSNNLIGYFIKLFYKDCYWVADFRDLPVGDNDTNIFFNAIQKKLNKLIYKKADAITTVSNGMKEYIKQYNNNIHVITNGFDIDISKFKENSTEENENFNILYTGSLYKGKRDASVLFKAVKILLDNGKLPENLKLIYAGNDGNLWKQCALEYGLQNFIDIKGLISTAEVIKLQKKASINLLLTWSTKNEKGILTGKLFEYLSVKKPIICSVSGLKDNEINNLFITLNCGRVFYEGELDTMINVIEEIYMNKYSYDYNLNELEKYTSEYLTIKLEKILLKDNLV